MNLLFEQVSALGTVGLSTGITAQVSPIGRGILIASMIIGRVGTLTVAFAFARSVVSGTTNTPKGTQWWADADLAPMGTPITPYDSGDAKKAQVAQMFDNIAHRYDFLNHFFSLGIDKLWRRKAVRMLLSDGLSEVLDVATGTADFAIEAARKAPSLNVVGVDISAGMLDIGRKR